MFCHLPKPIFSNTRKTEHRRLWKVLEFLVRLGAAGPFALLIAAFLTVGVYGQGRGIPDITPQQTAALAQMNADCALQVQTVNTARSALTAVSLAQSGNRTAIQTGADALGAAELALANARSKAFATLQSSSSKLAANQIAALAMQSSRGGVVDGNSRGTVPNIKQPQTTALTQMTSALMPLTRALNTARAALATSTFADARSDEGIRLKVEAVTKAELKMANTRALAFAKIQASAHKLAPNQVEAFIAMGGTFAGTSFTQPDPLNFSEHEGYVSIFDGVGLKGWDGNPKFWRVEAGAIVGESTPQNPSGNSYLVYRNLTVKDFTLKFEIKVEGTGGSGFQYRSKTGLPWLANIADNVTANVGPVNLNWMMTGPQADFWPSSRDWTGQFYSENTPMRILAWRGQVVEGSGMSSKKLMGNIGDRQALNSFVKMNDWNEYTVIARGGTFIHIVNGQLMAVMVDDDPNSSNNQPGLFGIEIEATTKVSVRNIWVKKLN